MLELYSYVNGEARPGGRVGEDLNPAHPSEVLAIVHLADARLVAEAVESSRQAFVGWRKMTSPARGEILRIAGDLLDQRADLIGRDLTREEGKTLAEGIGETKRAASILRYYAGQALEPDGETYPSHSPVTFLYSRREPVGVVVAITPWNFPIAIPAWKIAPALVYGNSVVWKPAEIVPLTAMHLLQALIDAGLPRGVVNLVLGKGSEIGDVLATHELVDAISFTGSNPVGRSLQLKAVQQGKKVQLEMGGKNPAVVLADADIDLAVEHVARGAFLSAGQKCTATSRVIVEEAVLSAFQERLVDVARAWRVGDPLESATRVGPLASSEQMDKVLGYVERGRGEGGQALAGGERKATDGYYVPPTVLGGVDARSPVAREEIFGPVAVLLAASSYDEA
ncbi:MAG: aldehyde dehydrogenase family protein, partial [Chloroflexota bacterium]|nr:aldehyde dehydrogenase family protein [Chloroflexota bacterium]